MFYCKEKKKINIHLKGITQYLTTVEHILEVQYYLACDIHLRICYLLAASKELVVKM